LSQEKAREFLPFPLGFPSVDPLEPALGKQGSDDKEEAEEQFRNYLSQPQRWNHYTYTLNNPLKYIDPDGFEPIVVKLNIIFDKDQYTKEQKQAFIDSYVAQAKQDLGRLDIEFNVTTTEGTATNISDHIRQRMITGPVQEQ